MPTMPKINNPAKSSSSATKKSKAKDKSKGSLDYETRPKLKFPSKGKKKK